MREDDFIGQAFYWFTGEVKDVADPEKMNRVKVRCHGYHNEGIEVKHLPWATVMMPSTSQSSKGYGRTHELEEGSWVVGFFRDGLSAQDPLVLGSIATMTDGTIDIPSEASGDDNYPNNKVYKSMAGHILRFDNGTWNKATEEIKAVAAKDAVTAEDVLFSESEGIFELEEAPAVEEVIGVPAKAAHRSGEKFQVMHANGTTRIEFNDDGDIYIGSPDVIIMFAADDITIRSSKDVNVIASKKASVTAPDIDVTATGGGDGKGIVTISGSKRTRVM